MLYIIGTPIGNLEDLSFRAKRVLSEVDFVLAEDTRQTAKVFARYGIKKKMVSFHQHAGYKKFNWAVSELKSGKNIAYLTDAGTPNISDPGGKLVARAQEAKITVSPVPGPSALAALISVAPFDCSRFVFLGYFPKKKGREKTTEKIKSLDLPVFFFESPHRIGKTLAFLSARLSDYRILIGRELTKIHEEVIFADLTDGNILEKINSKGEFAFGLIKTKKY